MESGKFDEMIKKEYLNGPFISKLLMKHGLFPLTKYYCLVSLITNERKKQIPSIC
jgi:hypothetical protein